MKIVVLITALLWAGASSWWYICNIKGYCDTDSTAATLSSDVASSDAESSRDTTSSKDENVTIAISKTTDNIEETNKNDVNQSEDTAEKDKADKVSKQTENDTETNSTPSKDTANTEADTTTETETEDTAEGETNADATADATSEDSVVEEQPNPLEEDIPADDDNDDTKIKINRIKNGYPNTDVALLPKIKKVRIYSPSSASKSSDLNTNANRYFDKVVEMLKADETLEIVLTGYTDSKGGAARNKSLGLRRAKTLKSILVSKGAPAERIIADSLGEADPVWSNKTEDGRKKNRRVELESRNKE